jgi:nucleosome binding factor SPN SPT16 subunit
MGIEFRESAYVINAKNTRKLEANMVLNLSLGFQNLEAPNVSDPKSSKQVIIQMCVVAVD